MSKIIIARGPYFKSLLLGLVISVLAVILLPVLVISAIGALLIGVSGFLTTEKTRINTGRKFYVLKLASGYYGGKDPATGFLRTVERDQAIVFSDETAKKKSLEISAKMEEI